MASTDEKADIVAKYRDTRRFKEALKIIKPDPTRRAECEYDVAQALRIVNAAAKSTVRTPRQHREDLEKLAKKLRSAIELAAKAFPPEYQIRRGKDSWFVGEELKRLLDETARAIDWTRERVRKGSPRRSEARMTAVNCACSLLEKYGKEPGRSRVGPWEKLGRKLLGNDQADLFDYFEQSFPYLVRTGKIRLEHK